MEEYWSSEHVPIDRVADNDQVKCATQGTDVITRFVTEDKSRHQFTKMADLLQFKRSAQIEN